MTTLQERPVQSPISLSPGTKVMAAVTRISLGFVFLWAFLDKTFGLGKATPAENAWIKGGKPTFGYLSNVDGPFGGFFQAMAGQAWADWLFMLGLLGIGLGLILGIASRITAASGALLLVFMWMASLPLMTNPIMDDHLIYAFAMFILVGIKADEIAGLGAVWRRIPIVEKTSILH